AAQIVAAIELGKRISSSSADAKLKVDSPIVVVELLMEQMRYLKKEHFKVVLLDTKNQIISIEEISVGSSNASIVHPREVFNVAIRKSANSIILVHNHPSGDPTPSKEDIDITHRLVEAGDIIGIRVLDHIIIGDNKYVSLNEKNIIQSR
ncbi:MAG: DNA repair protein RadC, partial [Tissierellales bacterium]